MKHFSIIFVSVFVLTLFGCNQQKRPEGLPELVPVTLSFTQDGAPLTGAIVSLVDLDGNVEFTVGGTTDEQGAVALHTHGLYKGAPLGKFKVRVVKTDSDPRPPEPPEHTPEYEAYEIELRKNPPKTYTLVEKRYTKPGTTPLEIEITGPITQQFDVGKAIREVL